MMNKHFFRTWNFWHYRCNGKFEDFNKQAGFKFFKLPDPMKIKFKRDRYNTPLVAPDYFNC